MFRKYGPRELRVCTLAILEALEPVEGYDWTILWGELQKYDQFLESESAKRRAAEVVAKATRQGTRE